jgi:AraC-like DNA-binding protein
LNKRDYARPVPAILNARAAQRKFDFRAIAPPPALAPYVAHYWIVTWDLRGQEPYEQWVLPYPSVNMTFKAGRCRVAGVPRGRFSEVLEGTGRVFGVRFTPAGFRPFLGAPVSTVTARFVPVAELFGPDLADAVLGADDEAAAAAVNDFLGARTPPEREPANALADAVAARVAADPGLTRVDVLAAAFDLGVRRLQRLFAEHVGVGPKWVIRRFRLHEAADKAAGGADVDWVRLAADLGYSDQAHFTRDFTAMVGQPPARYARAQ